MLKEFPEVGTKYYTYGVFSDGVDVVTFGGDLVDLHLFRSGLAFATKQDAIDDLMREGNE
jgi:hypothetical protein